jgi:Transglycosylase SLT domain
MSEATSGASLAARLSSRISLRSCGLQYKELGMLVDPGNSAAASTVTGAIRQASQATGTSFNYLLATAQVESALNPRAGAATSSARGLFQFIEQTWLATMKQSGPALGYGRYAAAITKTASGRYEVKNPALRNEILKLRNDPTANAVIAGALTKANTAYLTRRLGRPPSEGELYVAHFLGAGGAARLIALAASNPNAKAADFFPHAAHANSSIFYDRTTGAARSVAQVRDVLTARYDVARSRPDAPARAALAASGPDAVAAGAVAAVPDTAGITNAFAAAVPTPADHDKDVFYGLFQDSDRAAPIASVVSRLWGVPSSASSATGATGASGASAPPSVTGGLLDLFKDPAQGS